MDLDSINSLFRIGCRRSLATVFLIIQLFLSLAYTLLVPADAAEQSIKNSNIVISSAWARAMLPGQPTGGGYLTIENTGSEPDRLIAVTSANAALVEVHQMSMDENVMQMRQITDGLEIPAGGKVELSPGGLHLMFKQIKAPFKVADTVKVTLAFEKSGKIDVEMPVGITNPN